MAFYISPPSGQVSIEELFRLAKCRMSFLQRLLHHFNTKTNSAPWEDPEFVQESDAIIEMTPKDTLSHFLLRICAGFNKSFANFLVNSETELFRTRYNHFSGAEKLRSYNWVKKQIKHVRRRNCNDSVFNEFFNFLLIIVQKLETSLKNNSDGVMFKVPFEYVLDMVAQRVVPLSAGMALVDKNLLSCAWTCLYKYYLGLAIQHQTVSRMLDDVKADPRVMAAVNCILEKYSSESGEVSPVKFDCATIQAEEVDVLVDRFPLCMQHLHQKLRQTHRLQHHSRVQYTLFLKEVGFPLQEALVFWKREYEQDPDENQNRSYCNHNWQKNSGKYLYSIRHLYGAEGNRKNYSAHTCLSLQVSDWSSGGCPFANFDADHLRRLMKHLQPKDRQDILETNRNNGPQFACRKYFCLRVTSTLQVKHDKSSDLTRNSEKIYLKSNESTHICKEGDKIVCHNCDTPRQCKINGTELVDDTLSPILLFSKEDRMFLKPADYFKSFSKLLLDLS